MKIRKRAIQRRHGNALISGALEEIQDRSFLNLVSTDGPIYSIYMYMIDYIE